MCVIGQNRIIYVCDHIFDEFQKYCIYIVCIWHTPLTGYSKLAAKCDLKPARCHCGSGTAPYALKLGVYIH